MNRLAVFLLTLLAVPAAAQQGVVSTATPEECNVQVPYGKPITKTAGIELCRHAYLVDFDWKAKIPAWVAYTLTPEHALGCLPRAGTFTEDAGVKPTDYLGSGYDRGHMAPNSDMSWDTIIQAESFLMTNMSPQLPDLNRGIWKELEQAVRSWAVNRKHKLLVYVGPVYFDLPDHELRSGVRIPLSFYKIVVDTETKEVLAFVFPQAEGLGYDVRKMVSSVADVQTQTAITFPLPEGYKETPLWKVDMKAYRTAYKAACSKESR